MILRATLILSLILAPLLGPVYAMENKTVYGYLEKVRIGEQNIKLTAKLDTGAKSASIYAINIQNIEKQGKTWLSFDVPLRGKKIHFEEPLVRHVAIKSRVEENNGSKSHNQRPVVLLPVQLGDKKIRIEVNLANRKNFLYPFLLGRDGIIQFAGIIDPAQKYTRHLEPSI